MVKVKKRSGKLEEFEESKIIVACKKAGATAKQATDVAKEVSKKVVKKTVVTAEELSKMVVTSLKKVNKAAADAFLKFRQKLPKIKKKK